MNLNARLYLLVCLIALGASWIGPAQAGQGCPFDDGSCQEYCNQQGCNLGYCGHFAWIQCICRKCGDEWNWYDKVHYKPDKQVNQTELDSLKLNGSAPIILTSNDGQQQAAAGQLVGARQQAAAAPKAAKVPATLTTLLIPDLSDGSKLDLNDIPDENSEKFLDYLAKNHEKLAQATGKQQQQQPQAGDETDEAEESASSPTGADEPQAEETVEIQISSSNNQARVAASTPDNKGEPAPVERGDGQPQPAALRVEQQQPGGRGGGQMTRLLRMAVHERLADDLY